MAALDDDAPDTQLDSTASASASIASSSRLVFAGETLAPAHSTFLLGHGTQLLVSASSPSSSPSVSICATVSGVAQRINQLLTVSSLHARLIGQIGDVLVGRIEEIGDDRWRVQVFTSSLAVLLLASIYLPPGVGRTKRADAAAAAASTIDSFSLRQHFDVGDLVVCEIQKTRLQDGQIFLHTRSERYGTLKHGTFLRVQSRLIRRCKQHFQWLEQVPSVALILGVNGGIFVYALPTSATSSAFNSSSSTLTAPPSPTSYSDLLITPDQRERIARVCNCILLLNEVGRMIYNVSIAAVYEVSLQMGLLAKQLRDPEIWLQVADASAKYMQLNVNTENEDR